MRWLLLPLLLSGCSAIDVEYTACSVDTECRDAFGRGWSCEVEQGLCEQAPPLARCSSEPASVLEDPAAHNDWALLGSVFEHGPIFDGMVRSARLPVLQVNDNRGGLDGTPVGIIECSSAEADADGTAYDDGLDADAATVAAGAWLSDVWRVSAIIGPATSGRALAAYSDWSPRGTLLISPSATSPELTNADGLEATHEDPGLLWRTAPPDSFQGQLLADVVQDAGATDVGIIAQTGAYGDGLADVFALAFDSGDRSSQKYPFSDTTDLSEAITTAASAGHDAVLVVSSDTNDIIRFFNGAGGLPLPGLSNTPIFLPDGAFSDAVVDPLEGVTPDAQDLLFPNVLGTVPGLPSGQAFSNFATQYGAEYDGADPTVLPFTAQAYDAAWLALSGYSWASQNEGGISGLGAARGLLQISDESFGTPLEIGPASWTTIQSHFAGGNSIDLQGASGPLNYGADGETVAPFDVWDMDLDGDEWNLHRWCCIDISPNPTEGCVRSLDDCEPHE